MWEEGGRLDKAVQQLGSAWKELLSSPDKVLGITEEFTRPGILKLLEQLAEKIDKSNELGIKYRFEYM